MTKASLSLLTRNATLEETELLKQAVVTLFTSLYPSLQLDMKDWELFKDVLSSLDENLLEKVVEIFVPRFEDLGFPFIIYGLSRL